MTISTEKGHGMRRRIAWWLVRLAKKIHPSGKATEQFMYDLIIDQMIEGKTLVRIAPELWKEKP